LWADSAWFYTLLGLVEQRQHGRFFGQVTAHSERVATVGDDLVDDQLGQVVVRVVTHHDPGTLGGQSQCDGATDAA
jgi:hypothetical protein